MTFEAATHTPTALAAQLERIFGADHDVLLAGSLGRAAIYDRHMGDAQYEYKRRRQDPLHSFTGEAIDIDVINPPAVGAPQLGPFALDAFNSLEASIVREDGRWELRSGSSNFTSALDERLFSPVRARTVFGIECVTLPPQTHLALLEVKGVARPKDAIAKQALETLIQEHDLADIPEELYTPFRILEALNKQSWFGRTKQVYRKIVPQPVRQSLVPLTRQLRNHLTA